MSKLKTTVVQKFDSRPTIGELKSALNEMQKVFNEWVKVEIQVLDTTNPDLEEVTLTVSEE